MTVLTPTQQETIKQGLELSRSLLADLDRDGVFGVPFLIVGREPFWGIDRLEAAAAAAGLTEPASRVLGGEPDDGGALVDDAVAPADDDHPGGCG